ncbi:MAG: ABC transporter substrate-binding protein [Chloroflexia bacterium]|nr:ABC transporter substrate-binding protein [Chloroflexia bacterium]
MLKVWTRRGVIKVGAAGVGAVTLGVRMPRIAGAAPPPLEVKDSYVIGYPQTDENNPWRIAQTNSVRDEIEARGWTVEYRNAQESTQQQLADVASLIAVGVDAIFLPPREETPLAQAVLQAFEAGIPVFCLDRNVDQSIVQAGNQYVCFIGSDFYQEGARAAQWLASTMNGEAQIIELFGTTGATAAIDRNRGFVDYLAGSYTPDHPDSPTAATPAPAPADGFPGMEIVASQTGEFTREGGRQVFETLYQANPEANAVYAHNDEMALGAIIALEAQGVVPGEDVILVSVDGSRDALQAIIDGTLGATVECSPFFGPIACDTLEAYAAGEEIPPQIINEDRFFDPSNAEEFIDEAY